LIGEYRPPPETLKTLSVFRGIILHGLIAVRAQSKSSVIIGRGAKMSASDFVLLFARLARSNVALPLSACIICSAVSDGKTASIGGAEFAPVPFLAPAAPAAADEPSSTSFVSRFHCPQTSFLQDILASATTQVPLTPLTAANPPRNQRIVPAAAAIVGIASMYDPNDPNDQDSGNNETASGERYDANGWTAAVRIDLRERFGGVGFGKNYRPGFALVQSSDKRVIVRINDLGPLKSGRIIDLTEQTMRYFDPTLQLGLIDNVKVTPLAGQDWALGPVGDERAVNVAGSFDK